MRLLASYVGKTGSGLAGGGIKRGSLAEYKEKTAQGERPYVKVPNQL